MHPFTTKADELLANLDGYHAQFYVGGTFRGPSLHFHLRAIRSADSDFERHLEYVYAALVSWGMHRMGRGGSKMGSFEDFAASLRPHENTVAKLRQVALAGLASEDWSRLEELFCSIQVMATGSSLVGHSKVLAHLLPHLVSPIDRHYTLRFLRGHTNLKNHIAWEWCLFRDIHVGFVHPLVASPRLQEAAAHWMAEPDRYPWDTSLPKVVDNLVIGRMGETAATASGEGA